MGLYKLSNEVLFITLRLLVSKCDMFLLHPCSQCYPLPSAGKDVVLRQETQDNRYPVEIRTEHLPSARLERYRSVNLFCRLVYMSVSSVMKMSHAVHTLWDLRFSRGWRRRVQPYGMWHLLVVYLAHCSFLKMATVRPTKTSLYFWTTRRNIPGDCILHMSGETQKDRGIIQ
jgi:hypothetical protein